MRNIGETAKAGVLAAGLALGGIVGATSTATAQEAHNILSQTTFSTMEEAAKAAEEAGMILARAYNGQMRFVTPEIAELLDQQGFRYGRNGILFGYEAGAIFEGFNFKRDSAFLGENSTQITIEKGNTNRGNGGGDDDPVDDPIGL